MAVSELERRIVAPEALCEATRCAFRERATRLIEALPGGGRLIVDMSATRALDTLGLGTLVFLQRVAWERKLGMRLLHARSEVRFLLTLSRLDSLFELEPDMRT